MEKIITAEKALEYIGDAKEIHVFLNPGGMLLGADWTRAQILKLMETADRIELGGRLAMNMGHGVVITKGNKPHFISANVPKEDQEHIEEK